MSEDRALLLDCRDLAYQIKTALVVLEGHSNLWEMADVIYRDLATRARKEPREPAAAPLRRRNALAAAILEGR